MLLSTFAFSVMANNTLKLFCLIEGDTNPFEVTVSSIIFLKEIILEKRKNAKMALFKMLMLQFLCCRR